MCTVWLQENGTTDPLALEDAVARPQAGAFACTQKVTESVRRQVHVQRVIDVLGIQAFPIIIVFHAFLLTHC